MEELCKVVHGCGLRRPRCAAAAEYALASRQTSCAASTGAQQYALRVGETRADRVAIPADFVREHAGRMAAQARTTLRVLEPHAPLHVHHGDHTWCGGGSGMVQQQLVVPRSDTQLLRRLRLHVQQSGAVTQENSTPELFRQQFTRRLSLPSATLSEDAGEEE